MGKLNMECTKDIEKHPKHYLRKIQDQLSEIKWQYWFFLTSQMWGNKSEVKNERFRLNYSTNMMLWYTVTQVISDLFINWHLNLRRGSAFAVWLLGVGRTVVRGAAVIFCVKKAWNNSCVGKEWGIEDHSFIAGKGRRQHIFTLERMTHITCRWPVLLLYLVRDWGSVQSWQLKTLILVTVLLYYRLNNVRFWPQKTKECDRAAVAMRP